MASYSTNVKQLYVDIRARTQGVSGNLDQTQIFLLYRTIFNSVAPVILMLLGIKTITVCVQGSTNGIPISFKVLSMVPLVKPLVPMVMHANGTIDSPNGTIGTIPNGTIGTIISQWYHLLPMVPLVKLPVVPLGEPRTEPMSV